MFKVLFPRLVITDGGYNKETTILENDILLFSNVYHNWCDYFSFKDFFMFMKWPFIFKKKSFELCLNLSIFSYFSFTTVPTPVMIGGCCISRQLMLDQDAIGF